VSIASVSDAVSCKKNGVRAVNVVINLTGSLQIEGLHRQRSDV